MRIRADAGYTTHELMADSGHKTLSEVQRYTKEADMKRLAASGAAKLQQAQTENSNLTNLGPNSYKPPANTLKNKG